MKKIILINLLITICFGSLSPKEKDILELVKINHYPIDSLISSSIELIRLFDNNDKVDWNLLSKDIKNIMSEDDYYMIYIPMYDDLFSASEIKDLLRFYRSPTGRKMTNLTLKLTTEEVKVNMKYISVLSEKIDSLRKKNYLND
tara:strand:- start:1342 stop:1773 length:432 start_codon:yes stop_codon:yes gene_type:complete